jgi:hypothetical protein
MLNGIEGFFGIQRLAEVEDPGDDLERQSERCQPKEELEARAAV